MRACFSFFFCYTTKSYARFHNQSGVKTMATIHQLYNNMDKMVFFVFWGTRLTLWSTLTENRGWMAFTSSLFLCAYKTHKFSFQTKKLNDSNSLASGAHLAQCAVGLLIKELDLVSSWTGLLVRKTPGHLRSSQSHVSWLEGKTYSSQMASRLPYLLNVN